MVVVLNKAWSGICLIIGVALAVILGDMWWERSRPASQPLVAVYMRCGGMTPEEIASNVGALIEPPMKTVPEFTGYRLVPQSEAYRLELTFRRRTDAMTALKDVQSALTAVEAQLPEAVKRDGIHIRRLDRE